MGFDEFGGDADGTFDVPGARLGQHRNDVPRIRRGSGFEGGEIPRYYDGSTYPVDATSGAQSILTLLRFGRRDQAVRVARWLVAHLQAPEGYFYYQVRKHYTIRIPYARWSSAWMFAALAALVAPEDPRDQHQ